MRRFLIVLVLLSVLSVFAQNQASFGFSAKVEGNDPSAASNISNKEAILQKLKTLDDKYLSQLPKRQFLEASMIVEEIRELMNNKTQAKEEVNTQVTTTTESTQSVNINMNISGFDNPQTPDTQSNVFVTEPEKPAVDTVKENQPMNASAFNQLVSNIQDEAFSEDQLLYVRTAANSHYFSVNQIEQLVDIFTFAEDKIACLRLVYPKVTDKDNSFRIISHFTYEDDKKAAESIINQ